MTYGFRSRNGNNQINIDENYVGYTHLSTLAIPSQNGGDKGGYAHITFTCAGFPLIFFDVPYNVTAQDTNDDINLLKYRSRTGIALIKLVNNGNNSWTATFLVNNYNGPNLNLYMRVFGRANLNYPSGSGDQYGFKVRNPDGNLVFDAGLPMMRLGVDTYDTEIVLSGIPPGVGGRTQSPDAYDTSVNVGVPMLGKCISATARGMVYQAFPVTESPGNFQHYVFHYASLYWANGTTLYARRIATDFDLLEAEGNYFIDNSLVETVYSRVIVLDNTYWTTGGAGSGGNGSGTIGPGPNIGAPPTISQHPQDTAVLSVGNTATFTIVASNVTTYQWRKNGVVIPNTDAASYSFAVTANDYDNAYYQCYVMNSNGANLSNAALLNVQGTVNPDVPVITSGPQNVSVIQNGNAVMSITATGYDLIIWFKDDVQIFNSNTLSLNVNTGTIGSFVFKVQVSNGFEKVFASATLTVTAPPPGNPTITTQPVNSTTTFNTLATFTCVATPVTSYQWYLNNIAISGYTFSTATFNEPVGTYSIKCIASNSGATTVSQTVTMTVNPVPPPPAPVFSQHPQNATTTVGTSVTMSCAASPATAYQWKVNGSSMFGATGTSYSPEVSTPGTWTITCAVSNEINGQTTVSTSNAATLTVNAVATPPTTPVISTHPQNVTTIVGTGITMSCVASPVTSYQWRVNGANVGGTTSSTYSPNVSTAGTYNISCVASNTNGNGTASATSNTAVLTVNAPAGEDTFEGYQNLVYREDIGIDSSVGVGVSKNEGWGIGTGDPNLYSVRATGTGNTGAMSSSGQQLGVWYSFASLAYVQWLLDPPAPSPTGSTNSVTLSFSIKLNSSGATVSVGSGLLQASTSGE